MSLRYKILIAITTLMILILGVLTLNLWVSSLGRIKTEQNKVSDSIKALVLIWVASVKESKDWTTLETKLRDSMYFKNWIIVNDKLELIVSSTPPADPTIYAQDEKLRKTIETGKDIIEGDVIYAPVVMPSGETLGIKVEIKQLTILNPFESIKVILLIMPLGTILLIISIYVLLNRLVLKPIESLSEASRGIAEGNYNVSLPPATSDDEVGTLIKAFDAMLKEIKEYHTSLETNIEDAHKKIKTTQEQLAIAQRLSATGTLAAGIAHEINNPLGGIMNAVQALKKETLPPKKVKEYLDLINDGLYRMRETLKKILQFFPRKLVPQAMDLRSVIERASQLIQHRFDQHNIAVMNRIPNNLPQVFGDATELQQVFLNLLMNASDAIVALRETQPKLTDRGKIELTTELSENNITIMIADDGIGMDMPTVSRAFDIFYTTKEPGRGTGLGLAVVHNIIENHGGQIIINSKKNKGSTFKVTLPILQKKLEAMTKPTN